LSDILYRFGYEASRKCCYLVHEGEMRVVRGYMYWRR
jgi:hypothetical protein